MQLSEFEPLETLSKKMRFGLNYVNLIVLDASMNVHIAAHDFNTGLFKNFHTQKEISEPVMWCEIPRFNEGVFERLCDELAT